MTISGTDGFFFKIIVMVPGKNFLLFYVPLHSYMRRFQFLVLTKQQQAVELIRALFDVKYFFHRCFIVDICTKRIKCVCWINDWFSCFSMLVVLRRNRFSSCVLLFCFNKITKGECRLGFVSVFQWELFLFLP